MIYSKKYIFDLCPGVSGRAPKNSWNFLMTVLKTIFCCVNEMTFGKHQKLGSDWQWSQPCDQKIGTHPPPGRGEELETELNHHEQRL